MSIWLSLFIAKGALAAKGALPHEPAARAVVAFARDTVTLERVLARFDEAYWRYAELDSADEIVSLLNADGTRRVKIPWATKRGKSRKKIGIIYHPEGSNKKAAVKKWQLATFPTPEQVVKFLNGVSGQEPLADAQISRGEGRGGDKRFFVFYRLPQQIEKPKWRFGVFYKADDVVATLNGGPPGWPMGKAALPMEKAAAKIARVTASDSVTSLGTPVFYVFARVDSVAKPITNWSWFVVQPGQTLLDQLNGKTAGSHLVQGMEICFPSASYHYVFENQGSRLFLKHPIEGERFTAQETVHLSVLPTGDLPIDESKISWWSSASGALATGPKASVSGLNLGKQVISVEGDVSESVNVCVFADLDSLFHAEPSPAEVQRVLDDFEIEWVDGVRNFVTGALEETGNLAYKWGTYDKISASGLGEFNPDSTDPARIVAIARLDALRHQTFAEPLPFPFGGKPSLPPGESLYLYLKAHTKKINLHLDCGYNTAGKGTLNLNRGSSLWFHYNSETCTEVLPIPRNHVSYILAHEGRHNDPNDPDHVVCNGSVIDQKLENGSGHAWAALYSMWVYKYGLSDSTSAKTDARDSARGLLKSNFCSGASHSDPKIQALIEEIYYGP